MTFKALLRKWHTLFGTLLALPILVITATAVLMAHSQNLDLRNIPVNLAWLPGYQNTEQELPRLEIRSALSTSDNRYFIGTRFGLLELKNNKLEGVSGTPKTEIRSIKETPMGLMLASRKGVWLSRNNRWKKIFKGDAWEVEVFPNQTIRVAAKDKGFLESQDSGKHWHELKAINVIAYSSEGLPEEMNLGRLIQDLHTGRAFWGKQWGWIWIDLTALLLALIMLSGIVMKYGCKSRKPLAVIMKRNQLIMTQQGLDSEQLQPLSDLANGK